MTHCAHVAAPYVDGSLLEQRHEVILRICIHTYIQVDMYMYIYLYVQKCDALCPRCSFVRMYVFACTCAYMCAHVAALYVNESLLKQRHEVMKFMIFCKRSFAHVLTCIYKNISTANIHTYIHAYTHTYIHTHTYTHRR